MLFQWVWSFAESFHRHIAAWSNQMFPIRNPKKTSWISQVVTLYLRVFVNRDYWAKGAGFFLSRSDSGKEDANILSLSVINGGAAIHQPHHLHFSWSLTSPLSLLLKHQRQKPAPHHTSLSLFFHPVSSLRSFQPGVIKAASASLYHSNFLFIKSERRYLMIHMMVIGSYSLATRVWMPVESCARRWENSRWTTVWRTQMWGCQLCELFVWLVAELALVLWLQKQPIWKGILTAIQANFNMEQSPNTPFADLKAMINSWWGQLVQPCAAPIISTYFGGESGTFVEDPVGKRDSKSSSPSLNFAGAPLKGRDSSCPQIKDVIPDCLCSGEMVSIHIRNKQGVDNMALYINGVWIANVSAKQSSLISVPVPRFSARDKEVVISLEYSDIGLELDSVRVPYCDLSLNGSENVALDMEEEHSKGTSNDETATGPQRMDEDAKNNRIVMKALADLNPKDKKYEQDLYDLYDQYWDLSAFRWTKRSFWERSFVFLEFLVRCLFIYYFCTINL